MSLFCSKGHRSVDLLKRIPPFRSLILKSSAAGTISIAESRVSRAGAIVPSPSSSPRAGIALWARWQMSLPRVVAVFTIPWNSCLRCVAHAVAILPGQACVREEHARPATRVLHAGSSMRIHRPMSPVRAMRAT
jgi:hypothetical protein